MSNPYPCPCCNHLTLLERGGYEVCPVCYWEDDPVQDTHPDLSGGANRVSLIQARKNYLEFGACMRDVIQYAREPLPEEMAS